MIINFKIFYMLNTFCGLQVYSSNTNTIDGCATFFRRDRFSHVKKYEVGHWFCIWLFSYVSIHIRMMFACMQVEFNKAAQSLTEATIPTTQKKSALNRLVKVAYFVKDYILLFMFRRKKMIVSYNCYLPSFFGIRIMLH